jgi:hypothetical protein
MKFYFSPLPAITFAQRVRMGSFLPKSPTRLLRASKILTFPKIQTEKTGYIDFLKPVFL